MNLKEIAKLVMDDLFSGAILADTQDADLDKHDQQFHPNGFDPKKETCKFRDDQAKKDSSDKLASQGDGGGDDPKRKRVKEIFEEWRDNLLRSDKWLLKNLGLSNGSARNKAENVLASYHLKQRSTSSCIDKLTSLIDELPADAWKPGKKGVSTKSSTPQQLELMLGGTGFSLTPTGGQFSKFYHAQGSKSYSNKLDKATGLYETQRPGGAALAREEDVPGKSAFNKNRPRFVEKGSVPSSLSTQELGTFKYTANGSTYPMVGNVGGRNYIVKRGILPEGVRKNADLQDHIRKEVAADKFIRAAGLRAPVCTTFEVDRPKPKVQIDEQKLTEYFNLAMAYKNQKAQVETLEQDDNATNGQVKAARKAKDAAKEELKAFAKSLGKENDAYKDTLKARVKDGKLRPLLPSDSKELVKIAEYVDGGVSLVQSWFKGTKAEKDKIRQQVIEAYPVMSFLENVDAFKNDNILVDSDSNLWFVDNGACFDYRAQGGKKLMTTDKDGERDRMATSKDKDAKPWFYERNDPTDYTTGYFGLLYAPDQKLLQEILSDVDDQTLLDAAKKYNFTQLAATLPQDIQKPGLMSYAKLLDAAVQNPPAGWIQ